MLNPSPNPLVGVAPVEAVAPTPTAVPPTPEDVSADPIVSLVGGIAPTVVKLVEQLPTTAKVKTFFASHPQIGPESVDTLRLVADLAEGKTALVEGDVRKAIQDLKVSGPLAPILESDIVVKPIAKLLVDDLFASQRGAAQPTT